MNVEFDPNNPACVECGTPFEPTKRSQGGGIRQIYCSRRCSANSWARGNTAKRVISQKKYEAKPESLEKKKDRGRKRRLAEYGLTEDSFKAELERQAYRCLGCLSPIGDDTARIDHNHSDPNKTFRGLLCDGCNWGLGHVKDNRETLYRLAAYLRRDRTKPLVYIIGSLRNQTVVDVASAVREAGYEVFDEWVSAGPEADDYFQRYHTARGHSYKEALQSLSAQNTYLFDKAHLDLCDAGVLVMPAGKSAHLELGYIASRGKKAFILQGDDPERFDIMPQFAKEGIHFDTESFIAQLKRELPPVYFH